MLVSIFEYVCAALSLAELASVYPTAGGQYHFVSILSPAKVNLFASYFCGIFTLFTWMAIAAAVSFITAQMIVALVAVYAQTYEPQNWHLFLIYQGVGIVLLVYNIFLIRQTPRVQDVGLR
jgi:choline transport protein